MSRCWIVVLVIYIVDISLCETTCLTGCRCTIPEPGFGGLRTLICPSEAKLTTFPINIKNDTQFIRLPGNLITELPGNLSKMVPSLEKLDMRENKLQKLNDKAFAGLKDLSYVSLISNEITEIGADIFQGTEVFKLFMINFLGNKISKIHANAFRGLTGNILLRLQRNLINDLDKDTFAGVRNIQTMDLSDNQIEKMNPDLFRDQQQLYHLVLNGNKLSELHVNTLKSTVVLETIELARNNIASLPRDIFRNNVVLKTLDLRENQFTELPVDLFLPPLVKTIRLQGNPIVCDCTLKRQTYDPEYMKKYEGFNEIICANDPDAAPTKTFLDALDCETTTTTPTTTIVHTKTTGKTPPETNTTLGVGQNVVTITKTTTRYVTVDKTKKGRDKNSWPIVLGALLGVLVLIVCVGLFLYLYRRRIRDKIIEGTLTLTRRKKKLDSAESAEDFEYHDVAGWNGASTAMLKKTEGHQQEYITKLGYGRAVLVQL